MKKYELTTDTKTLFGTKLFRIKALVSFGNVKAGELGGYVESENNLSHKDNAWVSGNAQVYGNAWVSGNAQVYGDARVSGNAQVYGNAQVSDDARVSDNAWVYGNARVYGDARVCGDARVYDDAAYTTIKGFGSKYRNTTFFRCKDGNIGVTCGCFYGTLDEFREKVKETHGDSKIAKEYLLIADLMEYHFDSERDETSEKQNRQSKKVHQPRFKYGQRERPDGGHKEEKEEMSDLIDKAILYKEISDLEELARKRVKDTPTNSPAYMRYVSQLNERTAFKHMIADAPTINSDDLMKCGEWERVIPTKSAAKWSNEVSCSVCHTKGYKRYTYCHNCGAKMDGGKENE